nr:MAG TPA: hypothetical protein [Caudoviricetes sp.]
MLGAGRRAPRSCGGAHPYKPASRWNLDES